MFCPHVFGNISGGSRGISRKNLNFAGPGPREISEALILEAVILLQIVTVNPGTYLVKNHESQSRPKLCNQTGNLKTEFKTLCVVF